MRREIKCDVFYFSLRPSDVHAVWERLTMAAQWMTWSAFTAPQVEGHIQFLCDTTCHLLCKFTRGKVYFASHYLLEKPPCLEHEKGDFLVRDKGAARKNLAFLQRHQFNQEKMFQSDPSLAMHLMDHPLVRESQEQTLHVASYKDLKGIRPHHRQVFLSAQACRELQGRCQMTELLDDNGLARCIPIKYKCHLYNTFALIAAHTTVMVA